MGIIGEALEAAVQQNVTRPLPKSAPAQMRHMAKAVSGARPAAALPSISQRTVERYVRGQIRRPARSAAGRTTGGSCGAAGSRGNSVRSYSAQQTGITVETCARFGSSAPGGSTDDPRVRWLT